MGRYRQAPDHARRRALSMLAAGVGALLSRQVSATPEDLERVLRETFGERTIRPGKVTLDLPVLAENGFVVPVTVSVDSPMTPQDHVTAIHLFAEKNPLPHVLEVRLGPHNGKALVSTRIRLADSQKVTAIAATNDGSLWSAFKEIEVTTGGCGG